MTLGSSDWLTGEFVLEYGQLQDEEVQVQRGWDQPEMTSVA
jgi:hypothetical protein